MARSTSQTRPVIHVPIGVKVKTVGVDADGFTVIATQGRLGTVGEIVVRGRPLWPGWAALEDDPPPYEEIFACADDFAKVVRAGAKPGGIAVVRHSWVDARMRGTGLGRAIYEWSVWESRRGWGVALSADDCFDLGQTSSSATRVWKVMAASTHIKASGRVAWWRDPVAPRIVADVDVSMRAPTVMRGERLRASVRLTHAQDGEPFEARAFVGMMTNDGDTIVGDGPAREVLVRREDLVWPDHFAMVSSAEAKRWRVGGGGVEAASRAASPRSNPTNRDHCRALPPHQQCAPRWPLRRCVKGCA